MTRKVFWFPLLVAVLVNCTGEPFGYHPASEIPEGPGIFSGEEGAFVLSSNKKKRVGDTAANAAAGSAKESSEYEEFEEYQRWRRTDKNTEEYREFLEWREWKAYKKWKDGQPK